MDRSEPVAESPSLRPLPIASSILWTPHDVTAWAEADAGLSPNDADTHHALFEPWQIALVVVPREKPLGGVFRSSASDTWPGEPLPFYEWLDDDRSLLSNGRRVTDLPWQNYRTAEDTVPSDRLRAKRPHPGPPAVAPTVTPTAHVLFPDEPEEPPLPGRAWEGGARLAAPRA